MTFLWNSPLGLLLVNGALLGLTLPLGKSATLEGVAPPVWALVISAGAGGMLTLGLLATGRRIGIGARRVRFYLVAGAISYAVPNLLMFSAIRHLGAGYTGIMFTLSPVITLGLSLLFGVRRPSGLGIAGIVVGFAGALAVALTRGEAGRPAEAFWVAIGLLLPVSLAAGNIYRSWDWPDGAGPIELAAGSHLAAAAMLMVAISAGVAPGEFEPLLSIPMLVAAQVASSSAMFAVFFQLQSIGGPVYLSQIGYVAAAIGLAAGILLLGETYQTLTWVGAAIIVAGVAMTTRAQMRS